MYKIQQKKLKYFNNFERKRKQSQNSTGTQSTDDQNYKTQTYQYQNGQIFNKNIHIISCKNQIGTYNHITKNKKKVNKNIKKTTEFEQIQNLNSCNPVIQKFKTQLCKNFSQTGYCIYQNRCKFAHGQQQLVLIDKVQSGKKYRTKKCNTFWNQGYCPYGQRCQFKHAQYKQNIYDLLKWIGQDQNQFYYQKNSYQQRNHSYPSSSKLLKLLKVQ